MIKFTARKRISERLVVVRIIKRLQCKLWKNVPLRPLPHTLSERPWKEPHRAGVKKTRVI